MNTARKLVVIVDDEEQVVDSLRRTLRHENYEIVTFVSPTEALRFLETKDVDLLLSDIDMPRMTGLELIALARDKWPHVARVLLTGDSSLESAVAAINEGAVHKYLTKPWSSSDLRKCLREVIASVGALREQSDGAGGILNARAYQDTLEKEFPGFAHVRREQGAYFLNDLRAVERLRSLGSEALRLRATTWLVLSDEDGTEPLR